MSITDTTPYSRNSFGIKDQWMLIFFFVEKFPNISNWRAIYSAWTLSSFIFLRLFKFLIYGDIVPSSVCVLVCISARQLQFCYYWNWNYKDFCVNLHDRMTLYSTLQLDPYTGTQILELKNSEQTKKNYRRNFHIRENLYPVEIESMLRSEPPAAYFPLTLSDCRMWIISSKIF